MSVILLTFGCYDDSDIRNELRDHEERIAQLETLCKQMNTNISALQTIVSTLQKNVFVTAVTPIKEGSDIVGYTISFSNSESVTIYQGRDGVDGEDGTDGADGVNGATPSIGVRQDIDGIYYWTLDGEWLLDATGKKVQAVGRDGSDGAAGEDGSAGSDGEDGKDGADGETPQLKIENGYWYVSYDGEKWTQLGKATGESANLIGITQDDKNVYFTLTDGTVISIPKGNGGSQDDDEGGAEDGSQTISKGPITLSLGEVTATTATFTARLDVDMMADYQEVGLVYSKDDDMDVESETITKVKINKESYSETFTGLQYDTDFYYTVYTLRKNVYSYGATQTFKTKDVTISVDDISVTSTTATFAGQVARDELDESVEVGIMYSLYNGFSSGSTTMVSVSGGDYSKCIDKLRINTTYYYRTFICQNKIYEYGEPSTFTLESTSVDLSVSAVSQTRAVFSGALTPSMLLDEVKIGIVIDTGTPYYNDYEKKIDLSSSNVADGKFEIDLDELLFNTKYYYRYYILNNGTYTYGDLKNFKTEDIPVSISVDYNRNNAVRLKGNVKFTENDIIELSFQYSLKNRFEEDPSVVSRIPITEISDDGDFDIELSGLMAGFPYAYQYTLSQGDYEFVSDAGTFETHNPYDLAEFSIASAVDLSSEGTANCYIVSEGGVYKFYIGSRYGKPTVLWESFGTSVAPQPGDLIKCVKSDDGYIYFQTSDGFKEGNAVIALINSDGSVKWSWHIWMTDVPSEQVYYNDAGIMMDRNLGATSATPGEVGSLGLLYQWGRKDPFLGSSSINENVEAMSTIEWPQRVTPSSYCGNIDYAIRNPAVIIGGYGDWVYSDRTHRWTSVKSEYDPCPYGWRVPDGGKNGIWEQASGVSGFTLEFDSANKGFNFSGKFGDDNNIWYPVTGTRHYSLGGVGNFAYYWSTTYTTGYGNNHCDVLDIGADGDLYNRTGVYELSQGASVRCCKNTPY